MLLVFQISQLLGDDHLEHVVIQDSNYPFGLRVIQWITCFYFGSLGLMYILYPHFNFLMGSAMTFDYRRLLNMIEDDEEESSSRESGHDSQGATLRDVDCDAQHCQVPIRMCGVAYLALTFLFVAVAVIHKDNRRAVRIALIVEAFYFLMDVIVSLLSGTTDFGDGAAIAVVVIKLLAATACLLYYRKTHPVRENLLKRQD
ncbi:unnamed protein product [Clavelina lepadiformis]|uniref:Tumor protein p53-inducible protein 11 n=1 Tax=Clavelina lepadiformis TaxID=159417 RepID=A0ABP0EYL5_CLALP